MRFRGGYCFWKKKKKNSGAFEFHPFVIAIPAAHQIEKPPLHAQ